MNLEKIYFVFCDGGARGNPGPAAVGFVVYDSSKKVIFKGNRFIGIATNNVAEYSAVIEALKWFLSKRKEESPKMTVRFSLDSLLVVNQLNGIYKIKNLTLKKLVIMVRGLERKIGANFFYYHSARESNKVADGLVNEALDEVLKTTSKNKPK
ncbi:ribonuclease HI family protein [Patescibacteria group bacterium]